MAKVSCSLAEVMLFCPLHSQPPSVTRKTAISVFLLPKLHWPALHTSQVTAHDTVSCGERVAKIDSGLNVIPHST